MSWSWAQPRLTSSRGWPVPSTAVAAVLVAVLTVLVGSPPWGGPGVSTSSLAWILLAGAQLLMVALLVAASPNARGTGGRAWRVIAAGLLLYDVAAVWLGLRVHAGEPVPVPFWTDAIWMCAYAYLVVGVALVGRSDRSRPPLDVMVDGLLIAFTVMTLASATVLNGLVRGVSPDVFHAATALAYPLWDLAILGVLAGAMFSTRPRLSRSSLMLAVGMLLVVTADVAYLRRAATGRFIPGDWYHTLYFLAWAAIAAAAWLPTANVAGRRRTSFRWRLLAPGASAAAACAVLLWDHYDPRSTATIVLASMTFGLVLARIALTFRELEQLSDAQRLAMTDDLTQLANRRRLLERLRFATQQTAGSDTGFALLVLDIDRFKDLNDTLGHHVGDLLLAQAAYRLRTALPAPFLVARLGGDEFAVLTRPGRSPADAGLAAAKWIAAAFEAPIELEGVSLPTSASVGIALCPDHGSDPESLLRFADVAMYEAKALGSGSEVYCADRDQFSVERLALGAELHLAPARGELRVEFQPIADPRSGRFVRAEALVRWQHPTRGLLYPDSFIAIAERTGSMRMITPAVLQLAAAQCAAWCRAGNRIGIAVNLSASDLLGAGFVDLVSTVLGDNGVDPELLQLEITEHGVLTDPIRAAAVLHELHAIGVGISIDDFGSGHASISHLRRLPVDELKIDKSLVTGVAGNQDSAALVRSTIILAHELGLQVVAEGIADPETLDLVTAWGVDHVQGYLIGRPARGEDIGSRCLGAIFEAF